MKTPKSRRDRRPHSIISSENQGYFRIMGGKHGTLDFRKS